MLASRRTGSCATWPCSDVSNPNMCGMWWCQSIKVLELDGIAHLMSCVLIHESVALNIPPRHPKTPKQLDFMCDRRE
jgi:hypothetical protein